MSLALNALFRKYAQINANLDTQEFQVNQSARTAQDSADRNLKTARKSLADNMASKGMTHSSVNLDSNVNLQKAYGEDRARAEQEQARLLTDIARKRIEAETEFQSGRAYDPIQTLFGG